MQLEVEVQGLAVGEGDFACFRREADPRDLDGVGAGRNVADLVVSVRVGDPAEAERGEADLAPASGAPVPACLMVPSRVACADAVCGFQQRNTSAAQV